ncbi:protein mono-ADP-ribosyltransferase PARP3-like [Biomphalaria glabrata]|uniref:Poly [ADP-ribose] polymerase n=1 Tax=Biomphalaria glabrata TaxID=6526 RepID=A0A9W3AA84_BIOGL|nr:protein mono-ADP-ribosyltransferase PARP3-like [Biomphalaria glabrata]XP_013068783.2 protein mono-ADP-ribosyltransferase PARP3-like [Biomphalaria glabrata]XP_013068784.2 protein mono-ADP-ribosyltransferase PARP3-like [Biomphalaria glabrata]XP_055884100.1 protein mono-ADP-ribosyltransferase PARP3-like [Biomphalaria glabrata]XP_055884101.1 protein mono-ADP-ribosyltransferase PARP3-like [Biomphalaria glabrata]
MPPKRKAAGASVKASKSKKVKTEPETPTIKDHIAALKSEDKGVKRKHMADQLFPQARLAQVFEDYDAMLNQTNIQQNNNKFYIIQVLTLNGLYYVWNRWGRVGESGQNACKNFASSDAAVKDFEKKFHDKTKNRWCERQNFKPVPGKYTLLEMAGNDEDIDQVDSKIDTSDNKITEACTLDKSTQSLIKLIFDNDMFKAALKNLDIDTNKMPLGKLSKTQIAKGFEALEALEEAINKKLSKDKIKQLTSTFYTIIPHTFGRSVPPVIDSIEMVQKKYDMLAVLGDIEMAQCIQKDKESSASNIKTGTAPHPLDVNYGVLNCKLKPLPKSSDTYKVLEKYFQATKGISSQKLTLSNIWEVDREGEGKRFANNDKIDYRKLLWHGTNVAVVAAILKTGLRIMPHSGGRVGRGIYFASEYNKSAGYVCPAQGQGILFLNEVALGKQHKILMDDCSLTTAPKGSDSVLACGQQEPDAKDDTVIKLDGNNVIVPQGKPKNIPAHSSSSFWQSEYLIYREDQARIRYLLLFNM